MMALKPIRLPVPAMTLGRVIRTERCEKCKFAQSVPNQPQLECHAEPPTATTFMVQPPGPGRQPGFITHTGFPMVQGDGWCGKWTPKVDLTS